MKSFIDYIATEEKIPSIPKQQLKVKPSSSKDLTLKDFNYHIEVLTTKQSAIDYILDRIFNNYNSFPPLNYEYYYKEYGKTKEDWEKEWKECYQEIKDNTDPDGIGYVIIGIDGGLYALNDISFDEFIYIYKNLNRLEFLHQDVEWGDVVYGGVIYPQYPFEEDEEQRIIVDNYFKKWVTDDRYEIKKIGKTEVVMKDKKYNIKYFK